MQHLWLQVISVIVLTLSYIGLVRGQVCTSEDITAEEWEWGIVNDKIDASFSGTLAEFRMRDTISITTESSSRQYIDAALEGDVLRIFTTEAFASYEDQETAFQIQLRITFVCASPSTTRIVFYQGINSANNHPPKFSESEYTIPVTLPLPKGFDLTFFKEVLARDIDLEHNQVTFRSPASDFIDVGTSERIGDDKKTFYATLVLNQQLLTLPQNFSFTITATDSGVEFSRGDSAQIHIVADGNATYIPPPRFEEAIYRGDISETGEFSCETPTIVEDTYSDELSYTLSGTDGDLFSVEARPPYSVAVTLKAPITEENLVGKTFFTATISANHPEVPSGSTVLLVSLPSVPVVTTPKPSFEKSLIRGSINAELELFVETIVLSVQSYTLDTTFSMTGDDSSTFTLTNEQNVVTIRLNGPLAEEELLTREFYSFVVAATNPVSGVAETAVLISLPPKICEECPECPEPTICPECPETTACPDCTTPSPPAVDLSPKFQNQFYSFTIKSNEFGKIGDVLAESLSADAVIEYSIATENAYFMTKLTIDPSTGEIFLQEEINSGYYEAEVTAGISVDDEILRSSSVIRLTVLLVSTCPDGNKTVEKSLTIQYLRENEIHRNIFPSKIDDCNYVIRSIQPNDKEYVTINNETNMLESISFDREDSIFNEYEVPQIQIKLKLNCDGDTPTAARQLDRYQAPHRSYSINVTKSPLPRSIDPSIGDGRWYTLTNDIDFTSDLTVINIIIEDVNDNYPIFDSSTPSFVGYPETAVANRIIPTQLTVIHATDIDAGDNARIRYSLAENNYFQINPDSGIITPLSDGWSNVNSVELMIYATDNYGARNGLSTSHALYVRKLEEQHLTIVTLRDDNLNSTADGVIEQLNAESSIKMLLLHSAAVPYLPISSRQRQSVPSNALRMIVYALDDNGQPLGTLQVQRQLEPFVNQRQLTFSSYEDWDETSDDDFEYTVWIIVVSVMSGIILLAVVALFLLWWFKIRPYEYKTMIDETATSQENLQGDFNDAGVVESTPPMPRFETEKRESVNISGSTEMESTDEPTKRAVMLLNLLDGDEDAVSLDNSFGEESERRERKKSQGVTFNELVERIDIETDPVRDSDTDLRR
ncbi:uncharacterized protein LOC119075215 [Bradysia coprophila]|uniref:uncharacterized protein LOC119075215 n=1 Tax=Bradysia coprophila TaxID=38358 RepID=UPI00187D7C92|nr:uncharacterized protein LOC119075215 [Bradysia coprophila]